MFRALSLFCKKSEEPTQPILDVYAQELLNELNKEVWNKQRILRRVLLAFGAGTIVSLGATAISYTAKREKYLSDYINKQKNPDTWDEPCGDLIAGMSRDAGEGYSIPCPPPLLSPEFSYYEIKDVSPVCYDWCMNLPGSRKLVGLGIAMAITGIVTLCAVAPVIKAAVSDSECGKQYCLTDLSASLQDKIKRYLSSNFYDSARNMTIREIRNILKTRILERTIEFSV